MAKDAYYTSHDANARRDPKILAMRSVYEAEGYGWYWMIVEILREQENFKIKKSKYYLESLALELGSKKEDIKTFIDDCINEFELFKEDDNFLWSESLLHRMKLKEEKSKKLSDAGKRGMAARYEKSNQVIKNNNHLITLKERKEKEIKEINKTKEKENNNLCEQDEISKRDIYLDPSIEKVFEVYEQNREDLPKLSFERRNNDVRRLISDFLDETGEDYHYFAEVCKSAAALKVIAGHQIDLKSLIKNHIGIMNGKYAGNSDNSRSLEGLNVD